MKMLRAKKIKDIWERLEIRPLQEIVQDVKVQKQRHMFFWCSFHDLSLATQGIGSVTVIQAMYLVRVLLVIVTGQKLVIHVVEI